MLVATGKDEGGGAIVPVKHSGPGLTSESLSRLVEPFYTSKPRGMGMRLSICRMHRRCAWWAHMGQADSWSPRNRSAFDSCGVRLADNSRDTLYQVIIARPYRDATIVGMSVQRIAPSIAIVDDDESMRRAIRALLQAAGLPALAFTSAEEFLSSGQQHEIGCLITDIRMPGMTGLELQAKLNAEQIRVPIIFVTGHGDARMRMQALRAGAVEFLAKPFDGDRLLDSVRAALDR